MDRLQQISAELIRLYRKQLNVWTPGKVATLKNADLHASSGAPGWMVRMAKFAAMAAGEIAFSNCGESYKE